MVAGRRESEGLTGEHAARVQAVAEQLRARPAGSRVTIRKRTPSHSVRDPSYKRGLQPVDVSGLERILAIDEARLTATVEGQVLLGDLCAATLTRGLLPRVVPEFADFTIAGLINGEGIQSSSHRGGLFSSNLESIELLTADGSTILASDAEHQELFGALPGSLGSLGIVTAATLRLMPAGRLVRLTCRRYRTLEQYVDAFGAALEGPVFLEGVIFGPDHYVVISGDFVDAADGLPLMRPDLTGERYFYQQVRASTGTAAVTELLLTTPAYLTRSVRGAWWLVECHADLPLLSETGWGRRLLDREQAWVYARHGFDQPGLSVLERERCLVFQDMGVKLERLAEGLRWVQQRLALYPIWNCAIKIPADERAGIGARLVVDIGLYGEPRIRGYRHLRDMRDLQQLVDFPGLWGVSYLSPAELRSAYSVEFERYERVRQRYRAGEAFPHLDEKVIWIRPDRPDRGKIPLWRAYRSFGPRWYRSPGVYLVLLLAYLAKLAWIGWSWLAGRAGR